MVISLCIYYYITNFRTRNTTVAFCHFKAGMKYLLVVFSHEMF